MSADLIALIDSDPAAGILAAAEIREQRVSGVAEHGTRWVVEPDGYDEPTLWATRGEDDEKPLSVLREYQLNDLTGAWAFIAAEANPQHALAAVRRWRGLVERHTRDTSETEISVCSRCVLGGPDGFVTGVESWPCPDLTETADEARAYLGGGA